MWPDRGTTPSASTSPPISLLNTTAPFGGVGNRERGCAGGTVAGAADAGALVPERRANAARIAATVRTMLPTATSTFTGMEAKALLMIRTKRV
jgi:hypothetical protein